MSQQDVLSYIKKTYMVPMRDGVKLFTVLLIPVSRVDLFELNFIMKCPKRGGVAQMVRAWDS